MASHWTPLLIACLLLTGCHTVGSHGSADRSLSYRDPQTGIQVERGQPHAGLDGLGWVAGTPTKLALWDRRADNHDVSPETERAVLEYMVRNGLDDSLLRINQYDPWGEWKRLTTNDKIGPGWRYTVGIYNGLKYTLLPGRVLGGDWYNPFTDSVHIYSDIPPLAISRAAYAKDVRKQSLPGTYAASQEIPIVNMIHETRALNEALAYSKQYGTAAEQAESNRVLSPDYGSSWGGQLASFIPFGAPLGRLAGAAVGHITNHARSFGNQTSRSDSDDPPCDTGAIDGDGIDWSD